MAGSAATVGAGYMTVWGVPNFLTQTVNLCRVYAYAGYMCENMVIAHSGDESLQAIDCTGNDNQSPNNQEKIHEN